jgi:hypothetical protein
MLFNCVFSTVLFKTVCHTTFQPIPSILTHSYFLDTQLGAELQSIQLWLIKSSTAMYDMDVSTLRASRYAAVFAILALICILTRAFTGLRNSFRTQHIGGPKDVSVIPYWIPWLGHTFQFFVRFQFFLADAKYAFEYISGRIEKDSLTIQQKNDHRHGFRRHIGWYQAQHSHKPKLCQTDLESAFERLECRSDLLPYGKILW